LALRLFNTWWSQVVEGSTVLGAQRGLGVLDLSSPKSISEYGKDWLGIGSNQTESS
jgi:hypothetical protein